MSSNSLALFRKGVSADLNQLAEEHLQHDLQQSDRDTLKSAAGTLSTHVAIGSLLGLGIGAAMAWRIRSNRVKLFDAFRAAQKPTHVRFADGREEAIPDITPLLQPTRIGDIAAYMFFSVAGLFLGGETGLLTGAAAARRTISRFPDTRVRVEGAYRGFRADVLRREIKLLESGQGGFPV